MPSKYCKKHGKGKGFRFAASLPLLVAPSDEEIDQIEIELSWASIYAAADEQLEFRFDDWVMEIEMQMVFEAAMDRYYGRSRIRSISPPSLLATFDRTDLDHLFFDDDPLSGDYIDYDDGYDDELYLIVTESEKSSYHERHGAFDDYSGPDSDDMIDYDLEHALMRSLPINVLPRELHREVLRAYR